MKCVSSLRDLEQFGIIPLTGEACGLMYRVLCDLTENGRRIVEKCFDVKIESEPWNSEPEDPHVASIMISNEMIFPLGVFSLLESYGECFTTNKVVVAFEETDDPKYVEIWKKTNKIGRRFTYGGTAGSRNRHEFTGRVT